MNTLRLQKDVEKAAQEEKVVSKDFGGATADEDQSREKLNHIILTHDFQRLYQKTYEHMLDRMKKDLISLSLTINDLTESVRSKKNIHAEERDRKMKSRELKLQSKYRLDHLMKNIDHE